MSAVAALAFGLAWPALADPPDIRVRLARQRPAVELSGRDLQITPAGRATPAPITRALKPTRRARVRATGFGHWEVTWDGEAAPQDMSGDRLVVRGRDVRLGFEAAPPEFELLAPRGESIDVLARLAMDDYLAGVLPAEMPILWPLEALKAQAVAARSFALVLARERRRHHYDVESNITDQVYKFIAQTRAHPDRAAKLRRVITETSGEVLTEPNGRVLKAHYSADCGCTTEDPRYVWGQSDGHQSTLDPTCGFRQPLRWHRRLARAEAARRVARALRLSLDQRLARLDVDLRTPTGRVARVVATMVNGEVETTRALDVNTFRRAFGYRRIRSANFSLDWAGDQLVISGSGAGHGVGLCQTGARAMAERGVGYRAILKQYYPGALMGRRGAI